MIIRELRVPSDSTYHNWNCLPVLVPEILVIFFFFLNSVQGFKGHFSILDIFFCDIMKGIERLKTTIK